MPTGRLLDRVAVVTGAGSGIGRACALRFADEGARLVVNDRHGADAEATVALVTAAGGEAVAHVGDVGDASYVERLVNDAVAGYGRLDVMHNNAGYGLPGKVGDVTDDVFDELVGVNLKGVLNGTRAAVRVFVAGEGGGVIINTASNAAFGHVDDRGPYGALKAAVVGLTKSTAVEYGPHGVRANAICPGPIETPAFRRFTPSLEFYAAQIPLRRLGRPEDVANLALFLASDEAAFVTGAAISIDGGLLARVPAPYLRPEDVGAP